LVAFVRFFAQKVTRLRSLIAGFFIRYFIYETMLKHLALQHFLLPN
jgi:hypothetical protein